MRERRAGILNSGVCSSDYCAILHNLASIMVRLVSLWRAGAKHASDKDPDTELLRVPVVLDY